VIVVGPHVLTFVVIDVVMVVVYLVMIAAVVVVDVVYAVHDVVQSTALLLCLCSSSLS